MVDLGKLERLNALRHSGALSDDEFQAQKERLLATGSPTARRKVLGLVAAAATLILIALAYVSSRPSAGVASVTPGTSESIGSDLPLAEVTGAAEPAPSPSAAVADFQWAMSSSILGLNPAFVEARLGPAKEKSADYLTFEVQRCEVQYDVKGNRIVAAHSAVNAQCQPTVDGRRITPKTTFGSFAGTNASLVSYCIFNCGNAADPTIDLLIPGYHANGFVDVVLGGGYSDASSDAMDLWESVIRRRHGVAEDDWENLDYEWFSCVKDAPPEVARMMRAETVISVTIGRDIKYC